LGDRFVTIPQKGADHTPKRVGNGAEQHPKRVGNGPETGTKWGRNLLVFGRVFVFRFRLAKNRTECAVNCAFFQLVLK